MDGTRPTVVSMYLSSFSRSVGRSSVTIYQGDGEIFYQDIDAPGPEARTRHAPLTKSG
jgi:hypothetical protein